MRNIIFIGGIHGSGKGTICKFITENRVINHLTASEVLKWTDISSQEDKKVDNINETQNRLITNLKKIIKDDEKYLLDGHYCLLNKDNEPEKIPIQTFIDISPNKLIVVTANPWLIKERLEKRDSKTYDINLIRKFQELELDYAEEISKILNVQLLILNSEAIAYNWLRDFLK